MPDDLTTLHAEHARFLWGLGYRLLGTPADADDLVQDTFVRAMERPPKDRDRPWRPWLTKVALNLGRDRLRARKRRAYVGPWVPGPIETGDEHAASVPEPVLEGTATTEGRYDLVESVSMAFLLALEVLTPKQRAVLLLRDVFDYSVGDAAYALDVSESDVKVSLHRAKRALADYDAERCVPTTEMQERTRASIDTLLGALATGDMRSAERLLSRSVVALSDGGGEFFAARVPIIGRDRVFRFYSNIARARAASATFEVRNLNGLPALVGQFNDEAPGQAPAIAQHVVLDASGRIRQIVSVLASAKLAGLGLTAPREDCREEPAGRVPRRTTPPSSS